MEKLKDKAKALAATIQIGKNGLNSSQIEEIKKQLKKRKLIKIKMLSSFIKGKDKKEMAQKLASATDSKLIDSVGFVVGSSTV